MPIISMSRCGVKPFAMNRAILLRFGDNRKQSIEQGSKITLDDNAYRIKKVLHVSEEDWLVKADAFKDKGFTLIFNDFAAFKKIADDLVELHEKGIPFRFLNFERLTDKTFLPVLEALQFERALRSRRIKKGLEKKRESGEQLGNPDIAERKGKVQRQRKLQAFKKYHDNIKVNNIIVAKKEEGWSLNRIAEYLNDQGYVTPNGAQYRAKTIQRMLQKESEIISRVEELEQELRDQFQPIFEFEDLNDGSYNKKAEHSPHDKRNVKLSIDGLALNQSYDKAIEFTIKTPLKKAYEVIILDNDKEDETPVFSKVYPAEERKVHIDLDEHVLLPGVHYISIATQEERYKPIINRRIRLRMNVIQPILDRQHLNFTS